MYNNLLQLKYQRTRQYTIIKTLLGKNTQLISNFFTSASQNCILGRPVKVFLPEKIIYLI